MSEKELDIIKPNSENKEKENPAGNSNGVGVDTKQTTFGLDQDGFFIFKIHSTNHPWLIRGFLDWSKDFVTQQLALRQKKTELVKPDGVRGFLNKWRSK